MKPSLMNENARAITHALPALRNRAGLAGFRGTVKATPADFEVEEIPAYMPCGEGEHLFLWIEKEDVSAEYLTRRIRKATGVSERDIGVAGLKDRRAVTRQFVSVPAKYEDAVGAIHSDDIRVLSTARHNNKLRTGHLQGNRFRVRISDVAPGAIDAARLIVDLISRDGFPNYFGEQRFGADGDTLELGFALLNGKKKPRDIPFSKRKFLLRLALSAAQSWLFNDVAARRLEAGSLRMVQTGDVMEVVESGGKFIAEDAAVEQLRCDAWETVITGPLFGPKMKQPTGAIAEWERETLAQFNIAESAFDEYRKLTSGSRRAVLCRPNDIKIEEEEGALAASFTLPPGVYATSLLRELLEPAT